ncbi:hypothetical protein [Streptomyces pacificus]|uniref:Integral membrane protein n=1 Tax=Streptomyces pacificus TaxID=2705029 RepID=A0A6A0AZK0_9ACTN|nr:hypothetical protein [Streptomyces pacificus]GFH38389.1 hypothetical protein SCWH03_46310 [Streptomyces pacificus]
MSYLRTFLPWIVFAAIPSQHWQWASLAALAVAVVIIRSQRRAGSGFDALIIELGSAFFFAALAFTAFSDPQSGLHEYSAALASGTLAVISGASLAIGKPFTLGIARRTTPREVWTRRAFLHTNVVITAVWTAAFALTAAVLALEAYAGNAHSAAATIVQLAGFAVPMLFTVRYVAHVRGKATAS